MNTYFYLVVVDTNQEHLIGIYSEIGHALDLFECMPELILALGIGTPIKVKIEERAITNNKFTYVRDVIIENYVQFTQ